MQKESLDWNDMLAQFERNDFFLIKLLHDFK